MGRTMVDAYLRSGAATPGRRLVRWLGPAALLAPIVAGLIVWYLLPAARGHDLTVGIALLSGLMIPSGLALVFTAARALDRAQMAVEVHRGRARELMDHSAEGVFIGGADGAFKEVNLAGGRLLGYSPDEIIGKRIADLLAPEDVSRLRESWDAMLERGMHVGEWRLRRKDGTYVAVEVRSRVLERGEWQGFVRDLTKEREGELSLQRTQEELESIISISADAIVSVDEKQRIVMYNDGAARIFGWSSKEVYGKPLDILIPERFRDVHRAHIARFAEEPTRARKMGERRPIFGLRKSGEEFAADAAISKIEVSGGNLFTVVLRDMTLRIELENELRRTKDLLDNVLESSTEYAVVALDLNRRIVLWNEGARRNYGYSSEEVMGKTIESIIGVPADDSVSGAFASALADGCVESLAQQRRKDGSLFVAKRLIAKRLDLHGEALGYLVMIRDVSAEQEQLAHEKLVSEVGATLAVTLDASELVHRFADLVTRSFADACIVDRFVNGNIVRHVVHRDPAKHAVAEHLEQLAIDRDRPHLTLQALEQQQPVVVSHVTSSYLDEVSQGALHRRLLGELGIVSLVVAPGRVRDRLFGAVAFASTVSGRHFDARDRARAEELVQRLALALENARLYELAQKAVLARDGVLGVVAHDLRSPLAAAKLAADMLSAEAPPVSGLTKSKMVERLQRSLGRASRLIEDLLDVSVIHAGHFSVNASATPPAALAREAIEMYASAAEQASVALTLEIDDEAGLPFVFADGGRVVQVLSNLLGNALKFTAAGGEVRVKLEFDRGTVRYAVADTGCGIAAEETAHLFDEFWQGKRDGRGAGLGLAIAKGIIEAHGGRIWVQSTEGVGTTFYFTLPAVPGAGDHRAVSGAI